MRIVAKKWASAAAVIPAAAAVFITGCRASDSQIMQRPIIEGGLAPARAGMAMPKSGLFTVQPWDGRRDDELGLRVEAPLLAQRLWVYPLPPPEQPVRFHRWDQRP